MKNLKLNEFLIFLPVLAAYAVLGLFYNFLWLDIMKFILFQAIFILPAGYLFAKWLISKELSKVQRILFGYPVTLVAIFILSWAGRSVHINFLEAVMLPFSLAGIYQMIKDKSGAIASGTGALVPLSMLFYIACMGIVFRMFILPSALPSPKYPGLYYQDSLWNVGITWSYIRGLPMEYPTFSGVPFGYHILQNISQACVYNFTGIDPFRINFYIEPLWDWFILIGLILYGGIRLARLPLKAAITFCAALLFTESFFGSGLQLNMYPDPLSFFFGLPVFILFIFYVTACLDGKAKLDLVYLSVLFIYFTATKAILGMIIPVTLAIIIFVNLFRKQFSRDQVFLIGGVFLGALFLKFTMFQAPICPLSHSYFPERSLAYQSFANMPLIRGHLNIVYPVYRFFSTMVRNLPQYALQWPVFLFFILWCADKGFRLKIKGMRNYFLFASAFFSASLILKSLIPTWGGEAYYIMYAQVVFLLFGALLLDYVFSFARLNYKIISVSLLAWSVAVFGGEMFSWGKSWSALPASPGRIWDQRASIDHGEWQAMEWLKKNSSPTDIFFSDRRCFVPESRKTDSPRFYGYSALSGRQAFAEGEADVMPGTAFKIMADLRWRLINKFLSSGDPAEQEAALKNIPAQYFIQSLRFDRNDFSKAGSLRLVYENSSVKIYKIIKDTPR